MPHEIMGTLHETGMPGNYHWLFWAVVVAGLAVVLFLVWRYGLSRGKRPQ